MTTNHRGTTQRNVSQGGGVSFVFCGGDERSEPQNLNSDLPDVWPPSGSNTNKLEGGENK